MESSWKSRIEGRATSLTTAALIGGLIGLLTPGPVHEGRFQNW